jgi:hypothetical protein
MWAIQDTVALEVVMRVGRFWRPLGLVVIGLCTGIGTIVAAQQTRVPAGPPPSLDGVRKSQPGSVMQKIADTEITIVYNRPVARGREIFGALVPYGRMWHPGADQASAIALSSSVTINGQKLAAGKYSIWAIPRADRWTMVFNRTAEVWHTPYPGEATDVLRFDVPVEKGAHMETLAFYFPEVEGKTATLRLHWANVIVPMKIVVP